MTTIGGHRDQRYRTELDIGTSIIGLKRAESDIISDIGINFYPISNVRHPNSIKLAQWLRSKAFACVNKSLRIVSYWCDKYFWISEWTQMSMSELFRYRNDNFQSDIFSSDIGITDDVGCRISPTLRLMSLPTYDEDNNELEAITLRIDNFFPLC